MTDINQQVNDLNAELLETLVVIGTRFIAYAKSHNIKIEGVSSLVGLIGKAQAILEEINTPYAQNPVISDAFIHPKAPDEDSTAPSPEIFIYGFLPAVTKVMV